MKDRNYDIMNAKPKNKVQERSSYMDFEHELIIPNAGFPFKLFQFEGKDGRYVREKHWHRSIEIFAVFEGNLTFYINEEKNKLQAGEFVLLNSNEIHSIHSPNPNKTIVLQIPLELFEKYYTEGNQFLLFSHKKREQDIEVMKLVEVMYEGICNREIGYEWKVQSNFFQLVYILVTKYRKEEISKEAVKIYKKLDKLSTITSYIRNNYKDDLTLESVAEVFSYSPTYLSRMFQKYAKTNYKAYLQSVRIEYAFKEFANTNHTVSDIALKHGFPNSKAFSKEFQKAYGLLPSEYRKRQKNAID